jgi:NAD(P)-dependent dehydrogenase (short-subunit alcohol dehydrogenase family)
MSFNLLITGANRGIGLEFVRQYAESGWRIFACCRNPQQAGELQQLAARHANSMTVHTLDVGNSAQIHQLANALDSEQIDLLINNAGIYLHDHADAGDNIDEQALMESYRINSVAPLVMAQAFKQNLARSSYKKIANITSKMGSIADNSSGGAYAYRSSKTALNMLTKSLAIDLAPRGISAIVLHPGWVQTDMGGSNAMISVEQSVTGMRNVIDGIKIEDSGKFYGYDGQEIPW